MATLYLPPTTDTPAIGQINHSGGYSAGATSIVVSTSQGTFPSPSTGQAFVAIINPNTTGLLDNANTERVVVTGNSSGTWTIPAGLANSHSDGEYVAIVLSTTWLSNLLQAPGDILVSNAPSGANQVLTSTGTAGANWQAPTVNSTSALELALTETVNYPPTSPLKGNTALWIQQNETFSALPPVTGISANGTVWTITFASSIVGTLGNVGDTFTCWTVDFLPSGWNVGNLLSTVTATITGTGTTITIPETSTPATATQLGTVQPDPVQSSVAFFGDRGIVQLEGTNTIARPPNQVGGLGPAFQSNMIFEPATSVTASFTLTSGQNTATLTGTPPTGIFVGMNVVDTTHPTYLPFGTIVGNVYYTIATNTTTITFLNKYSMAAQNAGGSSTDTLSFCNDILTAEQFVTGVYGLTNGQSTQLLPNTQYYNTGGNLPGLAQNWGQGYWVGSAWEGDSSGNTLTGIQQVDFISAMFTGQNANVAERVGYAFVDVSKPTGTSSGSLGTQIGFAAGLWSGFAPMFGVAAADNATALSSLGTLTVVGNPTAALLAALPQQGSGVIFASDGMHAFNWTGTSGSTFTGCTYSGNQAATVATGNPVQINPQFLTGVFGANNVGLLNALPTAFPSQAPTASVASASNGMTLTSIPLASSTVASASNGTSFATLTGGSLVLASTANFGSTGMGTITHSGIRYIFTWTANNTSTNTLTIGAITGLQSITVSTSDAVYAGNVIQVSSVQWFPDQTGTLYASNGPGLIGQINYGGTTTGGGTTATYVSGTSSATALSSLGTLTVNSTSLFPVAGTATIMTSGGPETVTWTGIGSATTLTGCTYSGTTSNTVINGSQVFLATTTTGPSGLGPAFVYCSNVSDTGYGITSLVTGMTLLGASGAASGNGATFQGLSLPNTGAPLICIGPGFQLPQPTASKMSIVAQAAATAALGVPTFVGLNPSYDGMEVRIVVARIPSSTTVTFESNGSSSGTLMSLGNTTRAVGVGGSLVVGWDANSRTAGEWVEYSASNLGGHG